ASATRPGPCRSRSAAPAPPPKRPTRRPQAGRPSRLYALATWGRPRSLKGDRCLSLKIKGSFSTFLGGTRADSLDNAITDHLDTIRRPDLSSTTACLSSGIARLSGPIWDRAIRVTQVCRLEHIVPKARSPNWPYGRFYRAPLSVPLETTLGAPRRGAKTTRQRWQDRSVASEDRNPGADNPPSSE